ncbi:hypothetical protein BEL04_19045 [Mucilaginibacter sp. PPCGB 2223]|uniref:hypothetical protein n=1 Tax=Mucilaginibacter sp. PPCGB 2223 TaxID=1886027 RepID=UPI0008242367|nr:hypothetical protein [Mucilaginibacter sp. PPCGB 2223]OCX50828.1 hypothetical protein BEL04_19045 [Mucilaginibacter sp. PPCGB 2223]
MKKEEQLLKNIKAQAQVYLLDASEFFPFGAGIDSQGNIQPFSAYLEHDNDRPDSLLLIDLLTKSIKKSLLNGDYIIAAIGIDITIKKDGQTYDGLEVHFFESDKMYKMHFKYSIKPNYVEFCEYT